VDLAIENSLIIVKNLETLEEYSGKVYIESDYIAKLLKWIEKKKYICEETMSDLKLVIEIFHFTLKKSLKSDSDLVKEELSEIKKEKNNLIRDIKLFQHYFLSFWKEKSRETLL
jgi:hypothetical protein